MIQQVKIQQVHSGFIRQTDTYELSDEDFATMVNLDESQQEDFILSTGTAIDSETEVDSIGETIEVGVIY